MSPVDGDMKGFADESNDDSRRVAHIRRVDNTGLSITCSLLNSTSSEAWNRKQCCSRLRRMEGADDHNPRLWNHFLLLGAEAWKIVRSSRPRGFGNGAYGLVKARDLPPKHGRRANLRDTTRSYDLGSATNNRQGGLK